VRILIVNNFAHVTGGADHHCLRLAQALRERGHAVAFLSTASARNEEGEGEFVACSVTSATRDDLGSAERLGVAARALWNREAAAATRRLLRRFRPDVVHLHKLYPQLSVAPVVLAARSVALVQTLHDYELVSASAFDHRRGSVDGDETRLSYRLLNTATHPLRRHLHAPRVDRFVAVSDWVAEIYEQGGIEAEVLPNFADEGAEEPLGEEARTGILFAGRLSAQKGALDVIELARRLPDTPVTVAGDGPLAGEVAEAARGLDNLDFRARLERSALLERMRAARVLVAPSRWHEPGALVALEAMSAGTPIVAYDRGGLAEYIRRANAGIVVEPGVDGLAQACRTLASSPEAWLAYSRAGRRAIREVHSLDRYLPRIETVYGEAVAAGGRARRAASDLG
jgi:glycosyltransferase involved in cell wall biosynthesis